MEQSQVMKVSVIIPTYNGAHKLPVILEALKRQSLQPAEVIVVVDGSTDNTKEILDKQIESFPSLRPVYQSNQGRGKVRNSGAMAATGELLVFFDDDMIPLPDCIEKHVRHHETHRGSILTGGLKEPTSGVSTEIEKYKSFLSEKWASPLKAQPDEKLNRDNLFLAAANFSIPRELFFSIDGFDPSLNDAEDFDLAVKAYKKGYALYYCDAAFAWHNDRLSFDIYIKRQRQYRAAHELLIRSKPWIVNEGFMKKRIEPTGLKKNIYRFFCARSWVNAAERGRLKFLPRSLRYKIYDLVITANGIYFPDKIKL